VNIFPSCDGSYFSNAISAFVHACVCSVYAFIIFGDEEELVVFLILHCVTIAKSDMMSPNSLNNKHGFEYGFRQLANFNAGGVIKRAKIQIGDLKLS